MNKTKIKMLDEMFRLQLAIDKKVYKTYGTSYEELLSDDLYYFALLDAFGEFIHELKFSWCWWRKNGPTAKNYLAAIEKFTDITHLVLSYCLAKNGGRFEPNFLKLEDAYIDEGYETYKYWPTERAREFMGYYINDILNYVIKHSKQFSDSSLKIVINNWFGLIGLMQLDFEEYVYYPFLDSMQKYYNQSSS